MISLLRRVLVRGATLCGAIALLVTYVHAAMPLDPYLLRPEDRPPDCREAPGFYPINPKVALFYDYKVYRVALPPAIERHAQSLECGSQKGTLYFFAYQDADQAEMAERFARSILTPLTPSLGIEPFPKGFVIISFIEPPEALRGALSRKIRPADLFELGVNRSSASAIAPEPVDVTPPITIASPAAAPAALPPAPAALPLTSSVPPVPAATAVPAGPEPDLSDEVLLKLQKTLECKAKGLDPDVSAACKLIQAFKKGKSMDPIVAAPSARVGEAFRITDTGMIRGHFYNVAVGNGRMGEIAIYPLLTETGVQEIEAKALIDHRREGRALPAKNELTDRIAKMDRPDRPVAFPTQGRSQVVRLGGGRRIFIRQSGEQWILISLNQNPQDLLDPTDLILSGLY